MDFVSAPKDRWVCPNDRQLALRAKLKTGWSVKTQSLQQYGRRDSSLDPTEQEVILQVIRRAEMLELNEQERVGRLVERLENMKRNALGNGTNQCVLCGESFGMLGAPNLLCRDCNKAVCHKCGIETLSASSREPLALCKICSETREMWKKSGAWFFKGLPKYVLPEKKAGAADGGGGRGRRAPRLGIDKWPRGARAAASRAEEDDSSSDDEVHRPALRHSNSNSTAHAPAIASANGRVPQSSSTSSSSGHRQGSVVTFDLPAPPPAPPGAVSPSRHSQRSSESLSQCSDASASALDAAYWRGSVDSCEGGAGAGGGGGHSWEADSDGAPTPTPTPSYHHQRFQHQHSLGHARRESQASWGAESDRSAAPGTAPASSATPDLLLAAADDASAAASLDHAQLGTIELSLIYDPIASALHCSLHRAKGLKPMDINGLSDPFCRLNLLPTGGKSNRLRTKTVHKTRNPEFNETLTFYGVTESELSRKVMHILVLDDDKYGHDFIGEARIPLLRLQPQQVRHLIVPLEKHYLVEQEDEVWGNDAWTRGQILLTLCYSTRRRALVVGIVRCANLIPMDNNGFSDPFVKLRLKPDPYHRKYKTSIKWKNLNPVFNEEFVFDTKMTELPKQTLELTVWDKDYGKSNDYLGGLELGFQSKGERLKHWVDMIKFPDHKHEGWHNLGEDLLGD